MRCLDNADDASGSPKLYAEHITFPEHLFTMLKSSPRSIGWLGILSKHARRGGRELDGAPVKFWLGFPRVVIVKMFLFFFLSFFFSFFPPPPLTATEK
jgi:hypothetical protein